MKDFERLMLFLKENNINQFNRLESLFKDMENLLLEVSNNIANQTAEAMKRQELKKVEKLQRKYKENLTLINQIKCLLEGKKISEKNQKLYLDFLKDLDGLNSGEIKRDPLPLIDKKTELPTIQVYKFANKDFTKKAPKNTMIEDFEKEFQSFIEDN